MYTVNPLVQTPRCLYNNAIRMIVVEDKNSCYRVKDGIIDHDELNNKYLVLVRICNMCNIITLIDPFS